MIIIIGIMMMCSLLLQQSLNLQNFMSSLHRETLARAPVTWMKVTVNRHVFYRHQVRPLPVLLSLVRSVVTQQLSEDSSLRVLSV